MWRRLRTALPFLVVIILLGLLVAAVNPANLARAVARFQWIYLLPLSASYLLYLVLRAARWHFLMRCVDAPNSFVDSILLFAAAQSALLVPAGQFLLPLLQKGQHGTLLRRSAATVLVQEIIFGVLVLPAGLPGLPGYELAGWLVLVAFVLSALAGAVMLHEGLANIGIALLNFVPILRRHIPSLKEMREHVAVIANTREAVLGSLFDVAAIAVSGTGLYITLIGLGEGRVGWTGAIGSYALGNAAAMVSALPGGLGANEDVSTAVLSHMGLPPGSAAAATLLFRAATLICGTIVGWAVLYLCRRRFNLHMGLLATFRHLAHSAWRGEA